jgi:DNA mismatch endonuclease (patch repair protein)
MDVHDKKTRSFNMSRIHSKDTKPEEIVRKYLFRKGFRYRKNDSRLPGKPDIVLPKYKTCIFVNGCFWHAHIGCKYSVWPRTNKEYWDEKLKNNQLRDEKNYSTLRQLGWKVITIWECEVKSNNHADRLNRLIHELELE